MRGFREAVVACRRVPSVVVLPDGHDYRRPVSSVSSIGAPAPPHT